MRTQPFPGDLIEHLRAFSTLAEMLSKKTRSPFLRTAQVLALDVSVLRRRVQTMEAYFGEALMSGRGPDLALTRAGARIAEEGARVLAIVRAMQSPSPREMGPLRIGCTGTFLTEILPRVLRALKRRFPTLVLQVKRAGARTGRELLDEGVLDFVVLRAPKKPERLSSIHVGDERTWLAIAKKHALASSRRVRVEDIAREPLIGYAAPSFTMDRVMRVLGPHGVTPWIELQGKAAALGYVAEGLGVAFVSLLASQEPSHAGVVLRDVTSMFAPVSFHLAWRPRALAEWESAFVDLVGARGNLIASTR